jgi:hypothetical protein
LIGLFDRDVFIKLGCCDLMDAAVSALGLEASFRLASAGNASSTAKILRRRIDPNLVPEALVRLERYSRSIPILSDEFIVNLAASEVFQRLGNLKDIDAGEQLLASAVLLSTSDRLLVSGDKRFVNSIRANSPEDWENLSHSFVSFEACVHKVVETHGFDFVCEKSFRFRQCDDSLRLAFGGSPNEENFMDGLTSFDPCREIVEVEIEIDVGDISLS